MFNGQLLWCKGLIHSGSLLFLQGIKVEMWTTEFLPRGFLLIYEHSQLCVLIFMRSRKKNGFCRGCERFFRKIYGCSWSESSLVLNSCQNNKQHFKNGPAFSLEEVATICSRRPCVWYGIQALQLTRCLINLLLLCSTQACSTEMETDGQAFYIQSKHRQLQINVFVGGSRMPLVRAYTLENIHSYK